VAEQLFAGMAPLSFDRRSTVGARGTAMVWLPDVREAVSFDRRPTIEAAVSEEQWGLAELSLSTPRR